jgi:hypothetical protein
LRFHFGDARYNHRGSPSFGMARGSQAEKTRDFRMFSKPGGLFCSRSVK